MLIFLGKQSVNSVEGSGRGCQTVLKTLPSLTIWVLGPLPDEQHMRIKLHLHVR
jgi:hypothetical protein